MFGLYNIMFNIILTLIILTSAQQQNKPGRMTELGGRQLALKQFQPGIHTPEAVSPDPGLLDPAGRRSTEWVMV